MRVIMSVAKIWHPIPVQIIRRESLYPYTSVRISLKIKVIGKMSVDPLRAKEPTAINFEPKTGTITKEVQKMPVKMLYRPKSRGCRWLFIMINK